MGGMGPLVFVTLFPGNPEQDQEHLHGAGVRSFIGINSGTGSPCLVLLSLFAGHGSSASAAAAGHYVMPCVSYCHGVQEEVLEPPCIQPTAINLERGGGLRRKVVDVRGHQDLLEEKEEHIASVFRWVGGR